MKTVFLINLLLISQSSFAIIVSGCGDYFLRGKLVKNLNSEFKVSFIILDKTNSRMSFEFNNIESVNKVLPTLDQFKELKVTINKEMDGTKGIIASVAEVHDAIPDPLRSELDIKKITSIKCIKY